MANTDKCAWCNSYGANNFENNNSGKKYVSVEKFCSQKCLTEYNERYTINWKKKPSFLVQLVILVLVIFIVALINSANNNSKSTNDSDQIENTNDQEENQENNNNDNYSAEDSVYSDQEYSDEEDNNSSILVECPNCGYNFYCDAEDEYGQLYCLECDHSFWLQGE
jgi:hypothetical protein